ncbi:MAG: hypothetical protein Q8R21_00445, partial [Burkholderiales bacterium]|nr:hypothetical protein [Burkholderiales bacterium]
MNKPSAVRHGRYLAAGLCLLILGACGALRPEAAPPHPAYYALDIPQRPAPATATATATSVSSNGLSISVDDSLLCNTETSVAAFLVSPYTT